MSNLGTLTMITDPTEVDELLTQQSGRSGKTEVSLVFDSVYPVGTLLLHTTDLTPTERGFQGNWEKIQEDYTLKPVPLGTEGLGDLDGTNIRSYPLPEHTHTSSLSEQGFHAHTHSFKKGNNSLNIENVNNTPAYIAKRSNTHKTTSWSGSHSHNITIDYTHQTDATVNILGKVVSFVVWERVS